MIRYGIFGGTFDPFTMAHFAICKSVIANGLVDKVIVIPTVVSYYRNDKNPLFCNWSRRDIIEEWVNGEKDIILDTHEYSIPKDENRRYLDMLEYVINKYSKNEDKSEFYTIIGGDSYNNFKTWYKYEEILRKSKLIVVSRNSKITEDKDIPASFINIGNEYSAISATKIREGYFNVLQETTKVEEFKKQYIGGIPTWKKDIEIEKLIAHTPIFDLVEVDKSTYPFKPVRIKSNDWATIIAELDGKILTVTQERYGIDRQMIELPCGMVEIGEKPINAAIRELQEETGYKVDVKNVKYLGSDFANPAFMTNKMHYFYIKMNGSEEKGETKLDEHEFLTSEWIKKDVFIEIMKSETVSVFMRSAIFRYLYGNS